MNGPTEFRHELVYYHKDGNRTMDTHSVFYNGAVFVPITGEYTIKIFGKSTVQTSLRAGDKLVNVQYLINRTFTTIPKGNPYEI